MSRLSDERTSHNTTLADWYRTILREYIFRFNDNPLTSNSPEHFDNIAVELIRNIIETKRSINSFLSKTLCLYSYCIS